jgi:hypothetical protein
MWIINFPSAHQLEEDASEHCKLSSNESTQLVRARRALRVLILIQPELTSIISCSRLTSLTRSGSFATHAVHHPAATKQRTLPDPKREYLRTEGFVPKHTSKKKSQCGPDHTPHAFIWLDGSVFRYRTTQDVA